MCPGQMGRWTFNRRRMKSLWRGVTATARSSGVECDIVRPYGDGAAAVQRKVWAPWSHTLWSSWNCPSRPTVKRWCRWQRPSPNPEGHGTSGDVWLCRAVSQVASAVADSGCDTDNLICFVRRGKGRGHICILCCQPWLWQQSLCVGFVASWFNIWARSLQGSDCLLLSFLSFYCNPDNESNEWLICPLWTPRRSSCQLLNILVILD